MESGRSRRILTGFFSWSWKDTPLQRITDHIIQGQQDGVALTGAKGTYRTRHASDKSTAPIHHGRLRLRQPHHDTITALHCDAITACWHVSSQ